MSTLEVLASCVPFFDGAVVTVIDAKKQRWYLAAFEIGTEGTRRIMADTDGTEADLVKVLEPYRNVLVTGPDAEAFAPKLRDLFAEKTIIIDKISSKAVSSALLELALKKYETDGADDIGQGPVYLRKSDAEIALEERQRKESGEESNG